MDYSGARLATPEEIAANKAKQAAGNPLAGPGGQAPIASDTDEGRLFAETRTRVAQNLAGMGGEAAMAEANRIALDVLERYRADVAGGIAPGIALQDARSTSDAWTAEIAAKNNLPPPPGTGPAPLAPGAVGSADVDAAWKTYQEGIAAGNELYSGTKDVPKPYARDVIAPVTAAPVTAAQMTPAERLQASLQDKSTVAATDTTDLAATAAGQGAGGAAAAARHQLAQQRAAQAAKASWRRPGAASGGELARQALLGQGEAALSSAAKIEEINQQDRMQAQAKIADLDAQRKTVQAQLDQARAQGDQNAINAVPEKLAELEPAAKQVNAQETNRSPRATPPAASRPTINGDPGAGAQGQTRPSGSRTRS